MRSSFVRKWQKDFGACVHDSTSLLRRSRSLSLVRPHNAVRTLQQSAKRVHPQHQQAVRVGQTRTAAVSAGIVSLRQRAAVREFSTGSTIARAIEKFQSYMRRRNRQRKEEAIRVHRTLEELPHYTEAEELDDTGAVDHSMKRVSLSSGSTLVVENTRLLSDFVDGHKILMFGRSLITGSVRCTDLIIDRCTKMDGLQIGGGVSAETVRVKGHATVGVGVHCDSLKTSGKLTIKADVAAREVTASGSLVVTAPVRCETFHLAIHNGSSKLYSVRADKVTVTRGDDSQKKTLSERLHRSELEVDLIVGNTVDIVNTSVTTIKGKDVTLGKGCNVLTVQYSNTLTVNDDAVVRALVKVAEDTITEARGRRPYERKH